MDTTTITPLGQRYLAALDTYEEVLLLRDLVDIIDAAQAEADKARTPPREPYYLVMASTTNEVLFGQIWYAEITHQRRDQARKALNEATDRYKHHHKAATLNRESLRAALRATGLPHPTAVVNQAQDLRAYQPWWRRRRRLPVMHAGYLSATAPTGDKYRPLNIPTPHTAIEFWRTVR